MKRSDPRCSFANSRSASRPKMNPPSVLMRQAFSNCSTLSSSDGARSRGKPSFGAFASAKAGLRSLSQTFAREFGPHGVHVAHVIIDGGIDGERLRAHSPQRAKDAGPDGLLGLDAIADVYWHLHAQPRSAWTQELDLRPYKEPF